MSNKASDLPQAVANPMVLVWVTIITMILGFALDSTGVIDLPNWWALGFTFPIGFFLSQAYEQYTHHQTLSAINMLSIALLTLVVGVTLLVGFSWHWIWVPFVIVIGVTAILRHTLQ